MQLSEIFRIGVVVPLTDETTCQLRNGNINNIVDAKFLPLTQEDFNFIWHTGFLNELSEMIAVRISEYENTFVDSLPLDFPGMLKKYSLAYADSELNGLFDKLSAILLFASASGMPVCFVF